MHLPRGFYNDESSKRLDYILQVKNNLYILKQTSSNWSELLKASLIKLNFKQNEIDPCLYFNDNM